MNSIDCDHIFGATNVAKVETFKIDGGQADFGDDPHLLGAPQGDAVVCWLNSGKVAVLGKLYSDNFRDPHTASVRIRFRRTSGALTPSVRKSVTSQTFWVASRSIEVVSPDGNFNQVRLRLTSSQNTALGSTSALVGTRSFNR